MGRLDAVLLHQRVGENEELPHYRRQGDPERLAARAPVSVPSSGM